MKHLEVNDSILKIFFKNLRNEDRAELDLILLKDDKEKEFIKLIKKQKDVDFVSDDNLNPMAIGGVRKIADKTGQIWLLCSNYSKNCKTSLMKYLDFKISNYKKEYDILFNCIYKTNFSFLPYLKKRGFKTLDAKNGSYKIFYYTNGGEKFDIRNFAGK